MPDTVTPGLLRWDEVRQEAEWPALLLGNGVSINVWPDFRYATLYERAALSPAAQQAFRALGTTDFEGVLDTLWRARALLTALGQDSSAVSALYTEVRRGLLDAVHRVHVPRSRLPSTTCTAIGREIETYERVFTLNYDLLVYWSILEKRDVTGSLTVQDFFGPPDPFDPDEPQRPGWTALWFVHGALHLWQDSATGDVGKWTSGEGNLLRDLPAMYAAHPGRQPLFVSEGGALQKQETIARSRYLRRAFLALRDDRSPVAVLGTSLSPADEHVVEALRHRERVAVGVRRGRPGEVVAAKAALIARLGGREDLVFFDVATHPLTSPEWALTPGS
ncbi:DUF4917 family protein [Motilibacter aurantiacus]|uniref:DUF4917 family protein n=1 Tax=Motilibacter aurantiacus TaxID=2714955 RepID=UPI00140CF8AE|nr:DUF4917 family protein [Motilibacter aurantiacus]NHC46573.1 DUF4917 family protein [Motilibacter aurantiacus]